MDGLSMCCGTLRLVIRCLGTVCMISGSCSEWGAAKRQWVPGTRDQLLLHCGGFKLERVCSADGDMLACNR
eukprot:9214308-Lingulodinium_polyedra.AAC.1